MLRPFRFRPVRFRPARFRLALPLALLVALVGAGCDSDGEGRRSDAQTFFVPEDPDASALTLSFRFNGSNVNSADLVEVVQVNLDGDSFYDDLLRALEAEGIDAADVTQMELFQATAFSDALVSPNQSLAYVSEIELYLPADAETPIARSGPFSIDDGAQAGRLDLTGFDPDLSDLLDPGLEGRLLLRGTPLENTVYGLEVRLQFRVTVD